MGSTTHNREFKAERELDEALAKLKFADKDLENLLRDFRLGSKFPEFYRILRLFK